MLHAPDKTPQRDAKLPHPFAVGSVISIVLGTVTVYIEMQNLTTFQWPWAATMGPILVFGYFPITLAASPLMMAIVMELRYRNTKGIGWYFGGSALIGFIFSLVIWGILFLGFVMSGPP